MRVALLSACTLFSLSSACAPECASLLDCPGTEVCTSDGACVQTDGAASRVGRVQLEQGASGDRGIDAEAFVPPSVFPSASMLIEGRGAMWGTFGALGAIEREVLPTDSDSQLVIATDGTEAGGFIMVNVSRGPGDRRVASDAAGVGVACSLNLPPDEHFDLPLEDAVVDVGDSAGVVPPEVQDELLEQGFVPLVVQASAPSGGVAVFALVALPSSVPAQ